MVYLGNLLLYNQGHDTCTHSSRQWETEKHWRVYISIKHLRKQGRRFYDHFLKALTSLPPLLLTWVLLSLAPNPNFQQGNNPEGQGLFCANHKGLLHYFLVGSLFLHCHQKNIINLSYWMLTHTEQFCNLAPPGYLRTTSRTVFMVSKSWTRYALRVTVILQQN